MAFALAPTVLPSRANAQNDGWRWSGRISDVFTYDTGQGVEAWTAEDGGRIRHRNPTTGVWSFQTVPDDVKDTLRRVHFLTSGPNAGLMGWAVGIGGWVLKTTDGGNTWTKLGTPIPSPVIGGSHPYGPFEDLQDIHFLDENAGWLVGLHSFFMTVDGGAHWSAVPVVDQASNFLDLTSPLIEAYALDVVEFSDGSRLGLVTTEPGFVLRSYSSGPLDPNHDLTDWRLAWSAPGGLVICDGSSDNGWYEPWDVEIGTNESEPLAIMVGGHGVQCGTIFASKPQALADLGLGWSVESHECTCGTVPPCKDCTTDPLYNDDPNDPSDLNRHRKFKTLYGVCIHGNTNAASAVGYNGQMVVRDPSSGVWLDRSRFATGVPEVPNSVIYGLIGTDTVPGASTIILGGYGGHLMESTDGGQTYVDATGNHGVIDGSPNRTQDVWFFSDQFGWQGGQFFYIANTSDFGYHWNAQSPSASGALPNCNALTFESSGLRGVAVGGSYLDPLDPTRTIPKIRRTDSGGQPSWSDAVRILGNETFIADNDLLEVDWAPGPGSLDFWAVGTGGLILHTTDGGLIWNQVQPQDPALASFRMNGVAFRDIATGIFVGDRFGAGSARQYRDVLPGATWTEMALLLDQENAEDVITVLTDVDVAGNEAWAVGEKLVGPDDQSEGVVLKAVAAGGGAFGDFIEQVPVGVSFPECSVTSDEKSAPPVLTEVEVAPNGDVWIGGACGRVWVLRASTGAWEEIKSQTDAHVTGFSFVTTGTGSAGYVNGMRQLTNQVIVRVQ